MWGIGPVFRDLLGVTMGVAVLLSLQHSIAAAQNSSGTDGDSGGVSLPEIRVIGTSPIPPPRRTARPAAAPGRSTAPARSTATAPPAAGAEPGAVDRDKIPSNIQVLSASDFDNKTPDLLESLERSLPGVSLGGQTGN
jgi:hypothetical protein